MGANNKETTLKKYENIIANAYNISDYETIKTGTFGILSNFLAETLSDAKFSYDTAFKESNIALADTFDAMMFHATINQVIPTFAQPAELTGYILVPVDDLTGKTNISYSIAAGSTINTNAGINFRMNSSYEITISSAISGQPNANVCEAVITNFNGETSKINGTIFKDNISGKEYYKVEIMNALQYSVTNIAHTVPGDNQYSYGTFYDIKIPVNSSNFYGIRATISSSIGSPSVELPISTYKYRASAAEFTAFLTLKEREVTLTLGDGLVGAKIPAGSTINIYVYTSDGVNGNFDSGNFSISGVQKRTRYKFESNVRNTNLEIISLTGISENGAFGGKNTESIDEIRENILRKKRMRNVLMLHQDYIDAFYSYGDVFAWSKRLTLFENTIMIDLTLRNPKDNTIVKTFTSEVSENIFKSTPFHPIINKTIYVLNEKGEEETINKEFISPFYYKYNKALNLYEGFIVKNKDALSITSIEKYNNEINLPAFVVSLVYNNHDYIKNTTHLELEVYGDKDEAAKYYFVLYGEDIHDEGKKYILNSSNIFYDNKVEINSHYLDTNGFLDNSKLENIYLEVHRVNNIGEFNEEHLVKNTYLVEKFKVTERQYQLSGGNLLKIKVHPSYGNNGEKSLYCLDVPFIDVDFYNNTENIDETLNEIFTRDLSQFNTIQDQEVQVRFFNTCFISELERTFLFDKRYVDEECLNTMIKHYLPIKIRVNIKLNEVYVRNYNVDIELMKRYIQVDIAEYLKEHEGYNNISFYSTQLERQLLENYPSIDWINIVSPPTIVTKDISVFLNTVLEETENKNNLLNYNPCYIYYDYNNIELNFI